MFRSYEIYAIWRELIAKKIKRKDIEWLKEHRIVWQDYDPKNKLDWARSNTYSRREVACRIMDVLDAKKDRKEPPGFKVILSKSYLLELAEMFGVSQVYANETMSEWKIEKAVIDAVIRQTGYKPL